MRAIIMAGGADEKWTKLGGRGRRHFQNIRGERVIDRIVRQLRERGVTDIGIVCPPMPEYDIAGTCRIEPTEAGWGREALNGRDAWSATERTLYVYGDTIFADAAMDTIVGFEARAFQMFGRFGNGVIKGGGGELFAFSFWPDQQAAWATALESVFELQRQRVIKRAGSWEAYRWMGGARGKAVGLHRLYPKVFCQINDGKTDDFDTPKQFAKLRLLFR